ncbi:MAG: hypothetical protein HRT88_13610 [Lentisphaeraceae bacterium]|nr:hypothetical protein [Lentisphaeraceae bacterium]
MKTFIITCLFFFFNTLQADSFSYAEMEISAQLIPDKDYKITEGTPVIIHVVLKNSGTKAFYLHRKKFLACFIKDGKKEKAVALKIEPVTQVEYIDTQISLISNRRKAINEMNDSALQKYLMRIYKKMNFHNKGDLDKFLTKEESRWTKLLTQAKTFDNSRHVLPGAELHFEISAKLPSCDQLQETSCQLSLLLVNSNGRRINFPFQAGFN